MEVCICTKEGRTPVVVTTLVNYIKTYLSTYISLKDNQMAWNKNNIKHSCSYNTWTDEIHNNNIKKSQEKGMKVCCQSSHTSFKMVYCWKETVIKIHSISSVQSLSCVRLFVTPWTAARQASLSITNCQNSLKLMSIELVMPSNHLILCGPLLLLPSIFPSIRVFSNESALHIRWPVLEFQLQHSSYRWTPRTHLL